MKEDKDLNLEIMNLMLRMRKAMSQIAFTAEGKEISMAQIRILHIVKMREGIKMTELAKYLDITGASTTSHIDSLVGLGFLERRTAEDDRRSVEVYLTRRGRMLFKKMELMRKHQMHKILSKLHAHDKQHLITILEKIINSFNLTD